MKKQTEGNGFVSRNKNKNKIIKPGNTFSFAVLNIFNKISMYEKTLNMPAGLV